MSSENILEKEYMIQYDPSTFNGHLRKKHPVIIYWKQTITNLLLFWNYNANMWYFKKYYAKIFETSDIIMQICNIPKNITIRFLKLFWNYYANK